MRTLYLLRHARAQRSPAIEDFYRPLDDIGRTRASAMAAEFVSLGLRPDLILCSAARRACETLETVRPAFPADTSVAIEEQLYMASAEHIMRCLQAAPDAVVSLMVIGHNPGLQELGLLLGGKDSDARAARLLISKMPTAALAALTGELARWRDLAPGILRLERLIRPKDLQRR